MNNIAKNGLWQQNPLLVQLLGLCPLLAISTSLVNAVSLGLATILVMMLANLAIASLRALIPYEIRIPVFVLIIAALVTMVDLAFNAFLHDLYVVLGIFIPLIVTNCIVLARVEAFAAKNGIALEITSRGGHNRTNGHVAQVARETACQLVVDSDAHAPHDLLDERAKFVVAKGAGLTDAECQRVLSLNIDRFLGS